MKIEAKHRLEAGKYHRVIEEALAKDPKVIDKICHFFGMNQHVFDSLTAKAQRVLAEGYLEEEESVY